jgi:hypothetical protein
LEEQADNFTSDAGGGAKIARSANLAPNIEPHSVKNYVRSPNDSFPTYFRIVILIQGKLYFSSIRLTVKYRCWCRRAFRLHIARTSRSTER